jgi:nucleoside-diphosphate kinase
MVLTNRLNEKPHLSHLEENTMAIQKTLSIIKPDATANNVVGKIIARFEEEGLRIAAVRKIHLSKREAEGFYAVHKERPFFGELTEFMSRSPSVVIVLEGENAVSKNREIMGATDPAEAEENTLRKLYAASKGENAVHGSDSEENAAIEIAYFFRDTEIF